MATTAETIRDLMYANGLPGPAHPRPAGRRGSDPMSVEPFTELELFPVEQPPSTVKVKTQAELTRELRPVWSKHVGRHEACDQCVRDLHEVGGVGPLPRGAQLVRRVPATGDVQRLCGDHAGPLRAADWEASPAGQRALRKAGRR